MTDKLKPEDTKEVTVTQGTLDTMLKDIVALREEKEKLASDRRSLAEEIVRLEDSLNTALEDATYYQQVIKKTYEHLMVTGLKASELRTALKDVLKDE